jgi:hypothetical protein
MKTQIDHGIFDYCSAHAVTPERLLQPEMRWRMGRSAYDAFQSGSGDVSHKNAILLWQ